MNKIFINSNQQIEKMGEKFWKKLRYKKNAERYLKNAEEIQKNPVINFSLLEYNLKKWKTDSKN